MSLRVASPSPRRISEVLAGLGDDLDGLTVGDGLERLRLLLAAGAEQRRLGQTLGLHAVEGLRRNLRREVGAEDADIDDLDAELRHLRDHQVARFASSSPCALPRAPR